MSRLEELVSDWELEEMRQEVVDGTPIDVIEFRHGLPRGSVSKRALLRTFVETRKWTDAELAFVRDNYPGHSSRDWRGWKTLDRSWDAIRIKAQQLRVTRRFRPWTEEELAYLADNYRQHGRDWDGWAMLHRTWSAIVQKAHYMRLRRAKERKLTREQVVDIRTSKLSGIQLAEKYGIATSHVSKIKNGKRYKEIV